MIKASCVLITKEKQYPQIILNSLAEVFDEVLIQTQCQSVYKRYELALEAKNDLIFVQDDDCIADVDKIFKEYNGQITNAMTPHHYEYYKNMGITLVGWGAFFPKKMIDFGRYLEVYGTDALFMSQADRVFTYLNQPFNSIVMDIQHLPTAAGPGRMSTTSDHWEKLALIKERLYNITI
jgi:hypothetical protein